MVRAAMKFFLLPFVMLGLSAQSEAPSCQSCAALEVQTKAWSSASSKKLRLQASAASYAALEKAAAELKPIDPQPELVHAVVQLFGAIYVRDYDPLHDNLSLFRDALEKPEFHQRFQQELHRLPSKQQQKLLEGLKALKARPTGEDS